MNKQVKRISVTALFTAVILVTTAFVKVPVAFGYVHIGDVFVMLAAYYLSPVYACAAAAIGAGLADLIAGYVTYIPATVVVKGVMVIIMSFALRNKFGAFRAVAAMLISSVVMLTGYFIAEIFLYGLAPAAVNILPSMIQPAVTIPVSLILLLALRKVPYLEELKLDLMPIGKHSKSEVTQAKAVEESREEKE